MKKTPFPRSACGISVFVHVKAKLLFDNLCRLRHHVRQALFHLCFHRLRKYLCVGTSVDHPALEPSVRQYTRERHLL